MTMQIATIILPLYDNDGVSTEQIRSFCDIKLLKAFGGFTMDHADGAWINSDGKVIYEPVCKYEIAADWSVYLNRKILYQIAKAFCIDARQECVFVGFPDNVIFVDAKVGSLLDPSKVDTED